MPRPGSARPWPGASRGRAPSGAGRAQQGQARVSRGLSPGRFGVDVRVEPCDLAQRNAPGALAAALRRRHIAIDVLVNNAGVLQQGEFTRMLPERHQELIDLNVSALTGMLAHFLPPMRNAGTAAC